MSQNGADLEVEGPTIDQRTQEHRYVAHGEGLDIAFTVAPREQGEENGWDLEIETLPSPPIVREQPWHTVDEARDAAVAVIGDLVALERMQREDMQKSAPGQPETQESRDVDPD